MTCMRSALSAMHSRIYFPPRRVQVAMPPPCLELYPSVGAAAARGELFSENRTVSKRSAFRETSAQSISIRSQSLLRSHPSRLAWNHLCFSPFSINFLKKLRSTLEFSYSGSISPSVTSPLGPVRVTSPNPWPREESMKVYRSSSVI